MAEDQKARKSDDADGGQRQRSKIGFPYADLTAGMAVAQAIHANAGNGQCSYGQLAAWMDISAKSSGFRIQLAAARLFGVIESDDSESYRLTILGRRIVDESAARKAKAEAFLSVPLFRALYENHNDSVLPPAAALEREISGLGVAEKQKDRARQVFERSAEQAGFFEHGKNRLVTPAIREGEPKHERPKDHGGGGGGGGGGGSGGGGGDSGVNLDPLIMALLRKIPPKEEGWQADKRLRWFKTLSMNVSEVYDSDQPVELEITISDKKGQAQG